MRAAITPFTLLARAGFRSRATYRMALVAGLATNSVFGLIRGAVLVYAVTYAGGSVAGYDGDLMARYVWIGQALLGVINLFPRPALAGRVRTGDIAVDFTRPIDIQCAYLAEDVGRSLYALLPRALPTLAIGWLVSRFTIPDEPTAYLLGLPSIALGVVLSFMCRMALELIAFWVTEVRGYNNLYMIVCNLFAGLYVPLAMMPDWLHHLTQATPFPAMFQYAIDICSAKTTGWDAVMLLGIQALWVALMTALGRVLLRAGRRRLEVQGG